MYNINKVLPRKYIDTCECDQSKRERNNNFFAIYCSIKYASRTSLIPNVSHILDASHILDVCT